MDAKIDDLKQKQAEYANLSGEAIEAIKNDIRKQINKLLDKKVILENKRLVNLSPEGRADLIIKTLRDFPDIRFLEITISESYSSR